MRSRDQLSTNHSSPGVHDVSPVAGGGERQLPEPLDEQHARVADLAAPRLAQLETSPEVVLVLSTRGEPAAEHRRSELAIL